VSQVLDGVKDLSQKSIVHCDLKPENILLSNEEDVESIVGGETRRSNSMETSLSNEALSLSVGTPSTDDTGRTSSEASSQIENSLHRIKLIDLGSACFEGHTSHTYIQSRFYRSPEVLIGVPYDSAIDMWSLGCVAAELFLGLPILPGVHEHDQLGRIREMIGPLPDRLVEQGSKSKKYFVKHFVKQSEASIPKISTDLPPRTPSPGSNSPAPPKATWRLKSRQEYIQSLSDNEIRRKGGLAKLQKQQTNRYFKRTKLADIIMLQGQSTSNEDKESLGLFAHFLLGVLDPDPLKRWTAYQASMHPFITGRQPRRKSDTSAREFDICWAPPWDPAICRRKLLDVQRTRERQRALRRSVSGGIPPPSLSGGRSLDAAIDELSPLRRDQELSPSLRRASRPSPSVESFQFNRQGIPQTLSDSQGAQISPPSSIGTSLSYQNYATGSIPQYHLPPNVNDVRMIGSLPQTLYASSASFTEYNTVAAVEQRVALSSMMLSGGYNSYGESSGLMMQGQSYSAVHGNNMHNSQHEADFGYALQRPGVVPSMDLSFSGASNLPPPQFNQVGYESSNRQMPPEHQRSRSFTHSGGVAGLLSHGRRASHGSHELSERQGLSQYMIQQGMCSATSIKEDANDYVLGGSMESGQSSLLPARSSIGSSATSSLLAQQLEGLSADSSSGGHYMSSQPPTHLGAVPVAAPPQVPATGLAPSSYGPGMPYLSQSEMPASVDSAGYYYTTYITPNGAVMSAPVNMDIQSAAAAMQMHSYGSSYGSYADHQQFPSFYAPPSSLHPQMTYPLSGLQQPPFEESRQNGPPPPHANRNNYYQHHRK
jgi:serine/threonine protein kinase